MTKSSDLRLKNFWYMVCLLVILVGFGVRIHNLNHDSFWSDEILTAAFSRYDLKAAVLSDPHHPPLFYVLTMLFIHTFGETEFTVRLLALFAGVLGLPLVAQMGKTLRQPWVGLWATVFLLLSPYHLKYSQEARHYTLLMAISLLTYILLVKAMQNPNWRIWLIYAVATVVNMYTHYGAFIVLATQATIIIVWGGGCIWQKKYQPIKYPFVAALFVIFLYLPWFPRLLESFNKNIGKDIVSDTGAAVSLSEWLRVSFDAFALYEVRIYEALPFLLLISITFWLVKKQWLEVALIVASLVLPFLFIQIFSVARGAFARYVIYTFPFFLLLIAVIPVTFLLPIYYHGKRLIFFLVSGSLIVALTFFSWRPIQKEYAHIFEDWRGILQYIDSKSNNNDIIVGLSLSYPNGFNTVSASLPYYLPITGKEYLFVNGLELTEDVLRDLPKKDVGVWFVVSGWTAPMQVSRPSMEITPFESTGLYVIQDFDPNRDTLQQIINFYDQLTPLALAPSPKCLIAQDLAALYSVKNEYWVAYSLLEQAIEQCPKQPMYGRRREVTESILANFLTQIPIALKRGNQDLAKELAIIILSYDDQNETALSVFTYENLMDRFKVGLAEIDSENSPEPVEVRKFLMPENGDEREVLFAHPTTVISFPLQLPSEPVIFHAQMGLDPQSRSWGGDGVTFIVSLSQTSGQAVEIFRQHLHNDETGYGWHDIELPLTDYAGQSITLTLTTEAGPAGDATGDWAGWSTPRIMWAVSEEK